VSLADFYHEIHALRAEGLEKYGRRPYSAASGPPTKIAFPSVGRRGTANGAYRSVGIGPWSVTDRPPIVGFVDAWFERRRDPVVVLEIGPGRGTLASHLRERFPSLIRQYYGIELDPSVSGPYERLGSIQEAREPLGLILASEVIEHMPAETFYSEVMGPLAERLLPDASMIAGIPNPLVPGGIYRDFTHVQNYPWYDLYALMRLFFAEVEIHRTHYVFNPGRVLRLAARVALAGLQELDWCEGLVSVASLPIRRSIR
jgi:hypothetical protein